MLTKYEILYRNKRIPSYAASSSSLSVPPPPSSSHLPLSFYFNKKERYGSVGISDLADLSRFFNETKAYDASNSIFVPSAKFKSITKIEIIENLRNALKNNVIQVNNFCFNIKIYFKYDNNQFFIATKGIPQGLNVSSVLCSFYFANLESIFIIITVSLSASSVLFFLSFFTFLLLSSKFYFALILENIRLPDLSLVMRLTDDYLILSACGTYDFKFILNQFEDLSKKSEFQFNEKKMNTNIRINIYKKKKRILKKKR